MTTEEKRKHFRVDSLHLLNYVYTDDQSEELMQGMGRTLNISETGMLLETHTPPISVGSVVSLTIGFEEDVVDIKGRVVYTNESKNDMYESGIEFFDINADAKAILGKYILAFNAK
ncbi:MAG: PilZ domain-containing protein [Desulfobacteraceae bacterium]|jgi:c-di-GMP-binding flagellar brake protein YcgR